MRLNITKLTGLKSRRPVFLTIIFVFLVLLTGTACNSHKNVKTLFWEIRSPENQIRGYLMGSVHVLEEGYYPFREEIENAFKSSQVLAVEVDMSKENFDGVTANIMQKALYAGDETLQDNLSTETYSLLSKRIEELELGSIDFFKKYRPWMLGSLILALEMKKMGLDYNFGVDKYFMDRAARNPRQKIMELESIKFQMKLFMGMSKKEAEMFLLSTIKEVDAMKKQLSEMIAAWAEGDGVRLEKIMNSQMGDVEGLEEFSKKLLDDRNVGMADKLSQWMQDNKNKRYFVVVGAGHMIGKTGLVKLLQEKGYKVTQK